MDLDPKVKKDHPAQQVPVAKRVKMVNQVQTAKVAIKDPTESLENPDQKDLKELMANLVVQAKTQLTAHALEEANTLKPLNTTRGYILAALFLATSLIISSGKTKNLMFVSCL